MKENIVRLRCKIFGHKRDYSPTFVGVETDWGERDKGGVKWGIPRMFFEERCVVCCTILKQFFHYGHETTTTGSSDYVSKLQKVALKNKED